MGDKPLKVIAGAPDRPLRIGGIEIPCYVLEDGTRVLTQRGMVAALGMSRGGSSRGGGDRLAYFVSQNALKPFVSDELGVVTGTPLKFRPPSGSLANSYPAPLLVELCDVILKARDARALQRQQMHIAARADILIRGFATVGIIALVDEATGYQEIRDRNELNKILDRYLRVEYAKWAKRFPDDFYQQIFRLRGWNWRGMKINRPQIVGHYTNDLVWSRLAPGVLEELKHRNPRTETGNRLVKHHQFLTEDLGHPALQKHIEGVLVLMKSVPLMGSSKKDAEAAWGRFTRRLQRVYPRVHVNQDLFDD